MTPDHIIPDETRTYEDMLRARHLDLAGISTRTAWAEWILVRQRLANLDWLRPRRLRIVRHDGGILVDEADWCRERLRHLDRVLAERGRRL